MNDRNAQNTNTMGVALDWHILSLGDQRHKLFISTLPLGPDPNPNNLPITWVQGTHNPADGESRQPLIKAGLWKAPSEDC